MFPENSLSTSYIKIPCIIFPENSLSTFSLGFEIIESLPSLPEVEKEILEEHISPEHQTPTEQDLPPEEMPELESDPQSGQYIISAATAEVSR